MISQSSHMSSLQEERTALQQERQSLANGLEGEFKRSISWEMKANFPALCLLSSMWKKTTGSSSMATQAKTCLDQTF